MAYSQTADSAQKALKQSAECAREMREAREQRGGLEELEAEKKAADAERQAASLRAEVQRLSSENANLLSALQQAQKETTDARAEAARVQQDTQKRDVQTKVLLERMRGMMEWKHLEALSNRTVTQQKAILSMKKAYEQKVAQLSRESAGLREHCDESRSDAKELAQKVAMAATKVQHEDESLKSTVQQLRSRVQELESDKKELMGTLNVAISRGTGFDGRASNGGDGDQSQSVHVHVHTDSDDQDDSDDSRGSRGRRRHRSHHSDDSDSDPEADAQAEAAGRLSSSALDAAERFVDSGSSDIMREINGPGLPSVQAPVTTQSVARDLPPPVRAQPLEAPRWGSNFGNAMAATHASQLMDWIGGPGTAAAAAAVPQAQLSAAPREAPAVMQPVAAAEPGFGALSAQLGALGLGGGTAPTSPAEDEPDFGSLKAQLDLLPKPAAPATTAAPVAAHADADAATKLLKQAAALFR